MTDQKEVKMNQEREQTKPERTKDITRREFLKKAGIAALGTAVGVVLPDLGKGARADAPVPAPQPDAPVEPVYTNKAFMPFAAQNSPRPETKDNTPLYLREFGAPERGVIMRNKVEQGGGNPTYVEMGDPELFENLLYLRETYGRPDLKLEITFYSSWSLLDRNVKYDPNRSEIMWWDLWAGGRGTFKERGASRSVYREQDKTLEFHISLPEPNPGKIPTKGEIDALLLDFLGNYFIIHAVLANESGKSNLSFPLIPGSRISKDLRDYPSFIYENGRMVKSALQIKMETVPIAGGK